MRIFSVFLIGLLLIGCKKKDPPKPPESAQLVFPQSNSECTTGVSLNETTSRVKFQWMAANYAETYELRVTNRKTNIAQTISTHGLSAELPLEKGVPFSWFVNARNSEVTQATASETWHFYNAGFETSHAPFPPEILSPKSAESVFKDINNEITLDWQGADLDNDIIGYDVHFSTENPPQTIVTTTSQNITGYKATVVTNTVYYWKIVAKDQEGNTADSGVFSFKAL
ncbi:hypothetical protein ACEZ3G_04435 [Maribacter algicola]|uniref:Uncharacterized protein n=1 Tax=Meishania litoralis TaxID=3434685 RepID=A0ACC7LG88_9FLAO